MPRTIKARYREGRFEPLEPLELEEGRKFIITVAEPEIPGTVLDPIAVMSGAWKDLLDCEQFEKEIEFLRGSPAFQKFLDERSACSRRIPLEEIEKELERELPPALAVRCEEERRA